MARKETGVRRQEAWSIGHKVEFRISDFGFRRKLGRRRADSRGQFV